jgi:hypothetical protein
VIDSVAEELDRAKDPSIAYFTFGVYQCGNSQIWFSTRPSTSQRIPRVAWSRRIDVVDLLWMIEDVLRRVEKRRKSLKKKVEGSGGACLVHANGGRAGVSRTRLTHTSSLSQPSLLLTHRNNNF